MSMQVCGVSVRPSAAGVYYNGMWQLDENAYAANQEALEAFYASWEDPMSTWEFTNIGKS